MIWQPKMELKPNLSGNIHAIKLESLIAPQFKTTLSKTVSVAQMVKSLPDQQDLYHCSPPPQELSVTKSIHPFFRSFKHSKRGITLQIVSGNAREKTFSNFEGTRYLKELRHG